MQKFSILYLLILATLFVGCGNSEKKDPAPTQPVADAEEELQQEVQEDKEALKKVIKESQEEEKQVEELAKESQEASDEQMAELLAESRAEEKRVEAMTSEKTAMVGQEQPTKDGDVHVDSLIEESKNDDALALAASQMNDNPAAPAVDGPVVLLYSVNDRVTKEEQANIFKAIKKKWFSDREFVEYPAGSAHSKSDVNQFEAVKKQYNGRTVFRAEVLHIYGEWEITVRVGKVEKFDEDYLEAPLDVWRIDHVQNADRLAKEIHYGKKLSF